MAMTCTPERGVAENARVVEEAPEFHCDGEQLRATEQQSAHDGRAFAPSFIEDDFEDERFNGFDPGAEKLSHVRACCQAVAGRARMRHESRRIEFARLRSVCSNT
jgi:hypothetical protein